MEAENKTLWAALARAQGKITEPELDKENSFFKKADGKASSYASLASVWKAIRAPLSSEGLSITQGIATIEGKLVLITKLTHESGEGIGFECPLIFSKQDMQGLGGAITYARRYSINAIVGTSGEADDDGNANAQQNKEANGGQAGKASAPQQQKQQQAPKKSEPPMDMSELPGELATEFVNANQLKRLHTIASMNGWKDLDLKVFFKSTMGIDTSKDILRKNYDKACNYLGTATPAKYYASMSGPETQAQDLK